MEFYFHKLGFWDTIFANWLGIVFLVIVGLLVLGLIIGTILYFVFKDKKSFVYDDNFLFSMAMAATFSLGIAIFLSIIGGANMDPTYHSNAVQLREAINSYYGVDIPIDVLENTALNYDDGDSTPKSLVYSILKNPGKQFSGEDFYIGNSLNAYKIVAHQGNVRLMTKTHDDTSSNYKEVTPLGID